MENKTAQQFETIMQQCVDVFEKKMKDYGSAWRILRTSSLTDQIYIKAKRIRSIQLKGEQKIKEGIVPEFIGIVNYSVMALIQLEKGVADSPDLDEETARKLFRKYLEKARDLMLNKNHDYGEAWRNMRISSLTDIILMKLLRIKQIENNEGKTMVSEGLDANYYDIINYSVFALIKILLEGEQE
ncbi:DUF1599 domain-containing protein [Candidatus Sulfidibacterium hydrothermale]|uniref:DUF1599 domain-containing protein n=1 Tax=Candidatus Sulfidibacterium hydrothermale TaxID=2875962 RepID=UPI001F0B6270|nr:DUF1599 domain-containing protein [Candidatus Sulfidibacterium hydrothermale]UBM61257.1 DUF1599 domain-containing protein [Candidatus Sulfidibacterium hydrothermale]